MLDLVGATGLEPARLAPRDPKSLVSASSTTRPRSSFLRSERKPRPGSGQGKSQADTPTPAGLGLRVTRPTRLSPAATCRRPRSAGGQRAVSPTASRPRRIGTGRPGGWETRDPADQRSALQGRAAARPYRKRRQAGALQTLRATPGARPARQRMECGNLVPLFPRVERPTQPSSACLPASGRPPAADSFWERTRPRVPPTAPPPSAP